MHFIHCISFHFKFTLTIHFFFFLVFNPDNMLSTVSFYASLFLSDSLLPIHAFILNKSKREKNNDANIVACHVMLV